MEEQKWNRQDMAKFQIAFCKSIYRNIRG